jgi:hypothetical protein
VGNDVVNAEEVASDQEVGDEGVGLHDVGIEGDEVIETVLDILENSTSPFSSPGVDGENQSLPTSPTTSASTSDLVAAQTQPAPPHRPNFFCPDEQDVEFEYETYEHAERGTLLASLRSHVCGACEFGGVEEVEE